MRINYTNLANQTSRFNRLIGGVEVPDGQPTGGDTGGINAPGYMNLGDLPPGQFEVMQPPEINQESLEFLYHRVRTLQHTINALAEMIIEAGVAASQRTEQILQQIGLLRQHQNAQQAIPDRVRVWYKTPAIVTGAVIVATVFTFKIVESLGSLAWESICGSSSTNTLPAIPFDVATDFEPYETKNLQKITGTATEVLLQNAEQEKVVDFQTSEDHIAARRRPHKGPGGPDL